MKTAEFFFNLACLFLNLTNIIYVRTIGLVVGGISVANLPLFRPHNSEGAE